LELKLTYNIHNYILKSLADNHEPSYLLQYMLSIGHLGMKSGKGWQNGRRRGRGGTSRGLQEYLIEYNAKQKNI
jgi:3-hydroxyacyl-CoA dehydrogenase